MEQNDLKRNLYVTQIRGGNENGKPTKRLKPKELTSKEKDWDSVGSFVNLNNLASMSTFGNFGHLPSLFPSFKGGSIIIQNWNTRTEIPPDIPLAGLPIIIDPKKIFENLSFKKALPSLQTERRKDENL